MEYFNAANTDKPSQNIIKDPIFIEASQNSQGCAGANTK